MIPNLHIIQSVQLYASFRKKVLLHIKPMEGLMNTIPLVTKSEYSKSHLSTFVNDYFSNSFEKMVSFFAKEKSISLHEMEEIMKIMENEVKKQKIKK